VQVGLPPNPTIGYVAGEIGDQGTAGQQGGFAGQKFITGGKLAKNRAVAAAEIARAEQELAATELRVLTDVRISFYRALVAQHRYDFAEQLVSLSREAVQASQQLLEAQEIALAGALQTEVELQNAQISLRVAENELTAARQQLSAVVGNGELPQEELLPRNFPTNSIGKEHWNNSQPIVPKWPGHLPSYPAPVELWNARVWKQCPISILE